MEIDEILKKLSICNQAIKDSPFGISKNDFYKIKTFFIYNLLKNKELVEKLKITVRNEKRGDEKFYSLCFDLGTESIKLHQHQKDIPLVFVSNLLIDKSFYEFSQEDPKIIEYINDDLKEYVQDIINFSKTLAPIFNYSIIRKEKYKYSLYLNTEFLFNRKKITKFIDLLYKKHRINTCNLVVEYNDGYVINRIAGVEIKKLS